MVHLKVHVEADAIGPRYRGAVVYLSSEEPFGGALVLKLRGKVAVTGCWPRWPDVMSERSAAWKVESYVRRFGARLLYSFGVRLDLEGVAELSASVDKWSAEGGTVELEACRSGGLKAVVGPLAPGYRLLSFKGSLRVIEAAPSTYVMIEGERVALQVNASGLVTGHLECVPLPSEMPFEVELKGLRVTSVERTLIVRLEDLLA